MESKQFIFLSTFYDKEEMRQLIILLTEAKLIYKLIDKTNSGNFKSPLSIYFEMDLLVLNEDFDRANRIYQEIYQ
jgi:hypothetical protein